MKISLKWIHEYVETPSNVKSFCDRLDLTGTGVEGVEKTGALFDYVVTGKVVIKKQHPDSDHMWVTTVDVGEQNVDAQGNPEPLQIVCGAQNFNAGDHIVTAMVGAELPGDIKIKKSKLRGVVSMGMNCSGSELGLSGDHSGILILPEGSPVGMAFADYAQLSDTVLDLEVTPNRPDCLSMVGMAREIGAMYGVDYTNPLKEMMDKLEVSSDADQAASIQVSIDDTVRCPRYAVRVISGVQVGPSPEWMVERLAAIGQRSINNIVDATNYILFLFGQPLHAFDHDKLVDQAGTTHIVVRGAHQGEVLVTLDGEKRELTSDMTVISTPDQGPVALAGVMGGLDTEVTEETTSIVLEGATFEAGRTSRTSRNLGLISESSMRYERGVDDHGIEDRLAAAAALIVEVAGGTVSLIKSPEGVTDCVDVWSAVSEIVELDFRVTRFCSMIGADISTEEITDILTRLGCELSSCEQEDVLKVVVPTFRPDLVREIDLYEEVLRLWGMDRVPATLPGGRGRIGVRSEQEHVQDKIHLALRASGLNETMTYSFAEEHDLDRLRMSTEGLGQAVKLINPMNADQAVMRQSIIPGLIRSVAYNQSHGVKNVQLYEMGVVFSAHEGRKQPREKKKLAGVLAGSMNETGWNSAAVDFDFFDGKGVLENLTRELAVEKLQFKALEADAAPHVQPGRGAEIVIRGASVGWVGEIHPLAVEAYDAQAPLIAFELDVEALVKACRPARDYVDVPVFPAVSIDVAFVVDEQVAHERLMQCMKSAGGKLLEDARLFDVYRDEQRVGAGKKSMAYALTYRSAERTLTGEEVEKAHARLVKKVCGATKAEVRG